MPREPNRTFRNLRKSLKTANRQSDSISTVNFKCSTLSDISPNNFQINRIYTYLKSIELAQISRQIDCTEC